MKGKFLRNGVLETPSGQVCAAGVQAALDLQSLHHLFYSPPDSEAAMEAAGSLAPTYPKVFSGRMVPSLEEELQSGRAGKGVVTGFRVKPFPSPLDFCQAVALCYVV